MTLRLRLALAMMAAALLPMAVTVALLLARADTRARGEAERGLERARRQAGFLVERALRDVDQRVDHAASELGLQRSAQDSVIGGPEEPAREVARALSERHALDPLEITTPGGRVLSSSRADVRAGAASRFAHLAEGSATFGAGEDAQGRNRPRIVAKRAVPLAREPLVVTGAATLGRALVASIAEITGEPVALVDPAGQVAERAGGEPPGERVRDVVRLGDSGWVVRVETPAGDVARERRDLLAAVAGLAPFALLSALALGVLLAAGIARPIRNLAARADEIAAERSGFAVLDPPRDEVARLTRSFGRMLDALSGSERQRMAAERIAAWQEVARRIAHEVKNPLSPIQLAVENLRRTREKAPADFDRALAEETRTILEEVESLRRLVDEFSRFARLPAPHATPCDPRIVVRQALALFAPRIEALGVRLDVADEGATGTIEADAEQLGRAVKNVVANALDAMEPVTDRRLAVALRQAQGLRGAHVEIEIRDSGTGLDRETARRIFEPYFTTRGDRGGTGLGMAIAYRIVAEHGGTIEIEGAKGRGATVTLRLPVRWQGDLDGGPADRGGVERGT